ncbi:hypothetical protein TPHA_0I01100 [Tetrapisispora phaffii CBS 4417]|uniref:Transporter n=1 Tax=Tetrapisispora phaffii (strain ATCC 24235 / CBS 4417 / NBRC 1672 / NRRL Y-8282 / UCD 70-5) TaxID=1071381 RepID=G8BXI8_TETPH|nr:hypothetical protein TPHA_0I01100 [Tetrapisispora phaffii CBS 4417]CCE64616.1 hypothetical protein TPHA_0I01100 [Tetrapisispora phaffii CBS 4417]
MLEYVNNISFSEIAYSVFQSVLQVVIISLAGFWSAYMGLLPKNAQKIVSSLNVDLFTPCLIFSKLARHLSLAKIVELGIIPIFYTVSTGISFLSGYLISKFFSLDKDETNFVIANSIFGNSNSLPVSLTLSLAYTLPNLTWDDIPNDTRNNVASRGILYLLIFQQIGQVLRWSWGYNKLMRWSGENHQHMPQSQIEAYIERTNSTILHESLTQQDLSFVSLNDDDDETYDGDENDTGALANNISQLNNQTKSWIVKVFGKITSYLNPPLYAMMISVIIAAIPKLQHELFQKNGFIKNTLSEAIIQLGSVSIPLILIVLGSNLYPNIETFPKTYNHNKLVIGSIIGRMILPSMILLPIITLAVKYINKSILDDPIFLIVGFLLTVSPPAIQLTQITQLNEFFEAEMASILFWGYVVLSLPVSIIVISGAIYVLQWANA